MKNVCWCVDGSKLHRSYGLLPLAQLFARVHVVWVNFCLFNSVLNRLFSFDTNGLRVRDWAEEDFNANLS